MRQRGEESLPTELECKRAVTARDPETGAEVVISEADPLFGLNISCWMRWSRSMGSQIWTRKVICGMPSTMRCAANLANGSVSTARGFGRWQLTCVPKALQFLTRTLVGSCVRSWAWTPSAVARGGIGWQGQLQ